MVHPRLSFDVEKKPYDGFYITLEEKNKTTFGFKGDQITSSAPVAGYLRKTGNWAHISIYILI